MSVIEGKTIGERVASCRRQLKMTAGQLSERSGGVVSRAVIANIENGRREDLTVRELLAISWAMVVPPAALVFDLAHPDSGSGIPAFEDFPVDEAALWFTGQSEWWATYLERATPANKPPASFEPDEPGMLSATIIEALAEIRRISDEAARAFVAWSATIDPHTGVGGAPDMREKYDRLNQQVRVLRSLLETQGVRFR